MSHESTSAQGENGIVTFLPDAWVRVHYGSVDSTMDSARKLLRDGSFALPFLVTAEHQANGKGRQGAQWQSVTGNLMTTFVVDLEVELRNCEGLSLAVGLAVRDACSGFGLDLRLKWPNDLLMVDGNAVAQEPCSIVKKVGGILIELIQHQGRVVALIGLGLNVASAPKSVMHSGHLNAFVDQPLDAECLLFAILPAVDASGLWCR
jgi:BirA family transcriptional regulator, biotin operon repressor / biotin---[acetyl-CoA-carboxylase] ligase